MSPAEDGPDGAALQTVYRLRLFVAGEEANSRQARTNLERLCEEYLAGRVEVEIVDVLQDFRAALAERVLVTPALVIKQPPPRTVVFGNLSDTSRVLAALGIEKRVR